MLDRDKKVYVAGHSGLVGSAILRKLQQSGFSRIITRDYPELDLTRQEDTERFFASERPDYVFLSAAKVGGIKANMEHPAQFYYLNSMIANNVIHSAYRFGASKLLFLGSSCIYPCQAAQPMSEEALLTGPFEPTNEGYALAKTAGLKMCDYYRQEYGADFISAMPTNMYGPNDNFDLETSHLLPALIRKFHEAKVAKSPTVTMWGTGKPYREFLHSDDLSEALLFLMDNYSDKGHVNVGTGEDQTILETALIIKEVVGYEGEIVHDLSKPDGMFRKQLDVRKLHALGWKHRISLREGISSVYEWYKQQL